MENQTDSSTTIEMINNNNDNGFKSKKLLNEWEEKLLSKCKQKIWLAPVLAGLLVPIMCIVSYIVAIHHEHVDPIWPYVSDTGTLHPMAGYFSQMMDTGAIIIFIFNVARYKQIKYYLKEVIPKNSNPEIINDNVLKKLYGKNFRALLYGLVISYGTMGIGNFRSFENLLIHFIATIPSLIALLLYMLNQIYIGRYLYKCNKIEDCTIPMTVVCCIFTISIAISSTTAIIAGVQFMNEYEFDFSMMMHWKPDMVGYWSHCISAITEWIALFTFFPFFSLCMGKRMKQFKHWDQIVF